jgi:maleate isomerase
MSALRVLEARRVAVLTPYDARANTWLGEYLAAAGFEPTQIGTLPVGPAAAAGLAPQEVALAARGLLKSAPGTDTLWVACGNVQTLEIVEELESQSGCAVVSSNLALLWASLRKCGILDRTVGGGRLWLH